MERQKSEELTKVDDANLLFGSPPLSLNWAQSNKFRKQADPVIDSERVNENEGLINLRRIEMDVNSSKLIMPKSIVNVVKSFPNISIDFEDNKKKSASKGSLISKLKKMTIQTAKHLIKGNLSWTAHKTRVGTNILKYNKVLKHWIENVRRKRKFKDYSHLTERQLYFIGDPCSNIIQDLSKKNSRISSNIKTSSLRFKSPSKQASIHKSIFRKIIKLLPDINPEGKFMLIWDILICLCIVYQFFTITIELFFDNNWHKISIDLSDSIEKLSQLLNYVFLTDLLMNFFTAYYEKGVLIYNKWKIFKFYLRKFFFFDVLSIIPLFIHFESFAEPTGTESHESGFNMSLLSLTKLLFMFQFLKLQRTFSFLDQIMANNKKVEGLLSLFKLCFSIMFTAHLLACSWYFVGLQSLKRQENSWLSNIKLCQALKEENSCSWPTRYIYSLYWATTTMITVGYGDVTPTNEKEIVFCLFSMVFGCGVFGYSLNKIGIIFEKIREKEKEFNQKVRMINRYMKRKNVEFDLQGRVRRYLEYIFKECSSENSEEEQALIKTLSQSLKKELLMQTNGKLLLSNPIFRNNFSSGTIEKLSEFMIPQNFANEEVIFEENNLENEKIFLIYKGRVDLFMACDNIDSKYINMKSLKDGEIFGEMSFFSGFPHYFSAVSVGFTQLFYIDKTNFIDILKEEPDDYEKFCMMRDAFISYSKIEDFFIYCDGCKSEDHLIRECPIMRYAPNRNNLILKHIREKKFGKTKRKRSDRLRSLNTLSNLHSLNIAHKKYLENYPPSEESDFEGGTGGANQEDYRIKSPTANISARRVSKLDFDDQDEPYKLEEYSYFEGESPKRRLGLFLRADLESPRKKLASSSGGDIGSDILSNFSRSNRENSGLILVPPSEVTKKDELTPSPRKGILKKPSFSEQGKKVDGTENSNHVSEFEKTKKMMTRMLSLVANPLRKSQKPHNNNDQSIKIESDFDKIRDFKVYFPYNNSRKVIRLINQKIMGNASNKIHVDDNNSLKELMELKRNYTQSLFMRSRRINKAKFTFMDTD